MIKVENLSKAYRQEDGIVQALEDINFDVRKGESCSIIGPSGCGKTTLLFIIAGLLKPTKGRVLVDGAEVSSPHREVALILQDYGLFPWKTVQDNVELGLRIRGIDQDVRRERAKALLSDLGLEGFEYHYPSQLSGGMQQRVGIARALALEPSILLMDEPFSSLDALTRERLQNLVLEIWRKKKITMLLVTHNIEEAVFLGEKIITLTPRPGRVLHVLENHGMGSVDYRRDERFFKNCTTLRGLLGGAKGGK
jgi:NitT/TauT family transport system ATP-binding protein